MAETKLNGKVFRIETEVSHLESKQYTTRFEPPALPSRVSRKQEPAKAPTPAKKTAKKESVS